jgi:hypothetical protein
VRASNSELGVRKRSHRQLDVLFALGRITQTASGPERIMAEITLEFIARQLDRVIADIADLKADMTVVMARLERVDTTVRSAVDETGALTHEVRALAGQQSRQRLKLDRPEGRLDSLEPSPHG